MGSGFVSFLAHKNMLRSESVKIGDDAAPSLLKVSLDDIRLYREFGTTKTASSTSSLLRTNVRHDMVTVFTAHRGFKQQLLTVQSSNSQVSPYQYWSRLKVTYDFSTRRSLQNGYQRVLALLLFNPFWKGEYQP